MAIHKKKSDGQVAARLLLESLTPVELPPAEINEDGVTIEREEFRPYLEELFIELEEGGRFAPVPMVNNDSMFVVHGDTRTFWVRLWHTDETRTAIDRLHVTSCMPAMQNRIVNPFAVSPTPESEDED